MDHHKNGFVFDSIHLNSLTKAPIDPNFHRWEQWNYNLCPKNHLHKYIERALHNSHWHSPMMSNILNKYLLTILVYTNTPQAAGTFPKCKEGSSINDDNNLFCIPNIHKQRNNKAKLFQVAMCFNFHHHLYLPEVNIQIQNGSQQASFKTKDWPADYSSAILDLYIYFGWWWKTSLLGIIWL